MKIVSNAGPLIAFGKLGRLDILQKLYGTVLVAQEVYEETVTSGIALGAPDADLIRHYFSRGILQQRQVELVKLQNEPQIEKGEKATIELALIKKAVIEQLKTIPELQEPNLQERYERFFKEADYLFK